MGKHRECAHLDWEPFLLDHTWRERREDLVGLLNQPQLLSHPQALVRQLPTFHSVQSAQWMMECPMKKCWSCSDLSLSLPFPLPSSLHLPSLCVSLGNMCAHISCYLLCYTMIYSCAKAALPLPSLARGFVDAGCAKE